MSTSAPPVGPHGKHNRQRMLIYAGAGIALLVLLFMRSKGSGGGGSGTTTPDPNATLDPNAGAASLPAGYGGADNSAYISALGDQVSQDLAGVSTALEDQGTSFQNMADAVTGSQGSPGQTAGAGNADNNKQLQKALKQLNHKLAGETKTLKHVEQQQKRQEQQIRRHGGSAVSNNGSHRKPQGAKKTKSKHHH